MLMIVNELLMTCLFGTADICFYIYARFYVFEDIMLICPCFYDLLMQKLQKDLQNSVLHQIPECGHIPHVEKPKSVAEAILEFLQGDHC